MKLVRAPFGTFARLLVVLAAVAAAGARSAAAQEVSPPLGPQARGLYEAGLAHYAARRFPEAIQALREAYALEPRREILFAEAQATRLGGDCPSAVALYQKFLATDPPPRQVEATRIALARCQEQAASPPVVPPPAPAPQPVAPPPVVAAPTAAAAIDRRPAPVWWRDRTGGALAAAALAAAGTGTAFLIAAHQTNARADRTGNYRDYQPERRQAESRQRAAGWLLLGGAVLAGGAAGRYLWIAWTPEHPAPRLALGGRF